MTPTVCFIWYILVCSILAYFHIDGEALVILTSAMLLDTLTWFAKASMMWSKPGSRTAITKFSAKALLYLSLIIISSFSVITVRIVFGNASILEFSVIAVMGILIMTELYSSLGNITAIYTWEDVQEYDSIGRLLRFMRDKIKSVIDKLLPPK